MSGCFFSETRCRPVFRRHRLMSAANLWPPDISQRRTAQIIKHVSIFCIARGLVNKISEYSVNKHRCNVATYLSNVACMIAFVIISVFCWQCRYVIPLPKRDKNGCCILLYKLGTAVWLSFCINKQCSIGLCRLHTRYTTTHEGVVI